MFDPIVPSHRHVFGSNRVQGGYIVLSRIGLIITSLEKKDLVATQGKSGSERCTTSTRANNDIFVVN